MAMWTAADLYGVPGYGAGPQGADVTPIRADVMGADPGSVAPTRPVAPSASASAMAENPTLWLVALVAVIVVLADYSAT